MWNVHFKSESGDDYYEIFQEKPTSGMLKTYMVKYLSGEVEGNTCYVHVESINFLEPCSIEDEPSAYKGIEWL